MSSAPTEPAAVRAAEFGPASRVQRILRTSREGVYRLALTGLIRTRISPGRPPKFHLGDARHIAEWSNVAGTTPPQGPDPQN